MISALGGHGNGVVARGGGWRGCPDQGGAVRVSEAGEEEEEVGAGGGGADGHEGVACPSRPARSMLLDWVGASAAAYLCWFTVRQGDGGGGVGWCGDGELVGGLAPVGGDEAVGGVVFGVEGGECGVELGADG